MNDDYLWDRGGEPDPEVERLEHLLGRYAHTTRPLPLAGGGSRKAAGEGLSNVAPIRPRISIVRILAAVAAVIFVVCGGAALAMYVRFQWDAGRSWDIIHVEGIATLDGEMLREQSNLGVGEELRTYAHAKVRVRIARVGEVEIGPHSIVTLVRTERGTHRMKLDQGTMNARLWAPPFTFGVVTPAGRASDLGCAFQLDYQRERGRVHVTSGWVEFENDFRAVLIPAGAVADVLERLGPGTPYYPDAPQEFRTALRAYDFAADRSALRQLVATARKRDAMTLLHLLEQADTREQRAILYDGLARLAPPPAGVTREGMLSQNWAMSGRWRDSLGIGGVKKWWLHWRDAF